MRISDLQAKPMKKFDFVHKIEEIKISIKGNGASNMNFFLYRKTYRVL